MTRWHFPAGWAVLLAGAVGVSSQTPAPVPLPIVKMVDQFDRQHDVTELRGDVVVLVYGDKQSANANREIGQGLHETFHPSARGLTPALARQAPVRPVPGAPPGSRSPNVHAVAIACVGKVPPFVLRVIRAQIRSGSPDMPVWLDVDDAMKQQFSLNPGVPNIVVLDVLGRYRYRATGLLTPAQFDELVRVVEAVRREAIDPARSQR